MIKYIFILGLLTNSAFADYYSCRITVNETTTTATAEYFERSISVSSKGYLCSGRMEDRYSISTISTASFGELTSSKDIGYSKAVYSEMAERGDDAVTVVCACGME